MAAANLVRIATFLAIACAFLRVSHAEPSSPIELRLIDGDTGQSVDGAIVMGYWSRNPLPSLGCIPGALLGLPVHCSGIPIVVAAGEARSDENGRVLFPDPERRGWKPTAAHWLQVVIFKDGYWAQDVGRNDWHEPRKSLCISKQRRPDDEAYMPVFVFPLMSRCINGSGSSPPFDERTEAERRWDSAKGFASSIVEAVERSEDRHAVLSALREPIAAVDPILLNARPPTRRFGAWENEDVMTVVRQLRGQPKYILRSHKKPTARTQDRLEGAP